MSMTVSAQVPQAVTEVGDLHQYRLVITPAPTAVDDPLRVSIRIPDGMAIVSTSDGMIVGGSTARWAGVPGGRPVVLIVRYG